MHPRAPHRVHPGALPRTRFRLRSRRRWRLDRVAAVNVVFLIVAFFVLLMYLQHLQNQERQKLPQTLLALPWDASSDVRLVVHLEQGGASAGAASVRESQASPDANGTADWLRSQASKLVDPRGTLDRVTVVVETDPAVPLSELRTLIRACQGVGFSRFLLQESLVADGEPLPAE